MSSSSSISEDEEIVPEFPKPPVEQMNKKTEENEIKATQNNTKKQQQTNNRDAFQIIPSNVKSALGFEEGKSLVNWENRTLKVLRTNRIFGGKIKEEAVDDYCRNLDKYKLTEKHDPFSMFNITGGARQRIKTKQNQSVLNIAYNKAKTLFSKKKDNVPEDIQLKRANHDLTKEFEDHEQVPVGINEDNPDGPIDACCPILPRRFGVNFCDRLCDNFIDPSTTKYDDAFKQVKQHRPYFTYWITFVQIIICVTSLIAYGISPIGFSFTDFKGLVTTINLEKQLISYQIKQNFWIGPAVADLIHLGAKYAPCMRNDSNIYAAIQVDRNFERESACCIRNDRGGCVQTTKEECSNLFSNWHKFNSSNSEFDYGSVCGLDPRFCSDPNVDKWSKEKDITLWPVCENTSSIIDRTHEHMTCEIIGRPCCIGVQGECIITTREHCDLRKGYFHDNAHLCAQVDCMQGICGMVDFLNNKSPDQVYRLFTSIFIHAGILQLLFTICFQMFVLRDVEKFAGCIRVSIIYIGSGIIGNLASSIFLPYQAEVGPFSCHNGIVACLYVEMFHARKYYVSPCQAALKTSIIIMAILLIGFLPMIDNFANVFGFVGGLLLSIIVFPNVDLIEKCKRVLIIVITTVLFTALAATLIILFYVKPIDKCDFCKLLSCPFSKKFCLDMDFDITRIRNTKI